MSWQADEDGRGRGMGSKTQASAGGLTDEVQAALRRLRHHADAVEGGWIPTAWHLVDSGDELTMREQDSQHGRVGVFEHLPIRPGKTVQVATRIDLPAEIQGVSIAGEPVWMIGDGTYPMGVAVDGRAIFGDEIPVVASGPALIPLLDAATVGDNGELRLDIDFADAAAAGNGPHLNLSIRLSTPGLVRRHELVDGSYARLLLAANLAVTEDEQAAVAEAARLVPEDVAGCGPAELEQLAADLQVALAPVAPRLEDYTVHCIAHSHIDLAWLWRWRDTREVIKRDMRSVLALMDEYKDFHFTHSQPAGYALIEAEEPELFAAIKEHIAEGRWEPATLQWVEGDTNMASGPAQARQVLEGVTYAREHLGAQPEVFLAPDTFGHAGNMPQLVSSGGGRFYYHHRGNPGIDNGGRQWPAYWWEGDDGSRVLAVSTPVYLGVLTAGRIARDVLDLGHATGLRDVCYFFGAGDHGGGPTRQSFERLIALQDQPGLPRIMPSTVGAYARAVVSSGAELPIHRGESMTVFEGCYTSHADTKRFNRDGENLLTAGETLSAVAGTGSSGEWTGPWREVLFNQFHDILDGSAIHEAYADEAEAMAEVFAEGARLQAVAVRALARALAPAAAWVVANPLATERRDVIEVTDAPGGALVAVTSDGTRHPAQRGADGTVRFVATVPALGVLGFRLQQATAADGEEADTIRVGTSKGGSFPGASFLTVDTPAFYAQIRTDCGVITTLWDKRAMREVVGYGTARGAGVEQVRPDLGLGVLQVLHEYPHEMTSWVIDDVYEEHSLIRGAEAKVVEAGPVRVVVETVHRYRRSTLTSRLVFYRELERIDLEVTSDWQEPGGPEVGVPGVVASFGARLDRPEAWYETPFAAARRPADGLVVPALRWADLGDDNYGVAVLNDGKYGHDALGSRVRVHLVRGSYEPDPVPEIGRVDRTRLAIYPHAGSWRHAGVVAAAAGFNHPLVAVRAVTEPAAGDQSETRAIFRPTLVSPGTAAIAAIRHARDNSGRVVLLYETAGEATGVTLGGLPAGGLVWEVSGAEDRRRSHRVGPDGELQLRLPAFAVRALLVEDRVLGSGAHGLPAGEEARIAPGAP